MRGLNSPEIFNSQQVGSGSSDPRVDILAGLYVRTSRFVSIGAGTSGTITIPANSTVVLDDFGGTVDAVICKMSGGRPQFTSAVDAGGNVISTTFDSSGNYSFSGTPSAYPVAIVYRVQQTLIDFDSISSDIVGPPQVVSAGATAFTSLSDVPNTYSGQAFKAASVKGDESGLEFKSVLDLIGYTPLNKAGDSMSGRLNTAIVALSDAATIATDASLGNQFTVTITASRTLGNPTNAVNGQLLFFLIKQNGTGGYSLSFDTKFVYGDSGVPVIATGANKQTAVLVRYNSSDDKFVILAWEPNF